MGQPPANKKSSIILGIDPGTLFMGFGIIRLEGSRLQLVEMGTLKLGAIADPYERLSKIHESVMSLINRHAPNAFAIEAPFYGKNVQSMLKLGRAQGVALAAAIQSGLKACEYSPRKVKKAITGNGNATKEQVSEMIQHILKHRLEVKSLDATDALAVAICHHFQLQSGFFSSAGKGNSWKAFIEKHPDKVSR